MRRGLTKTSSGGEISSSLCGSLWRIRVVGGGRGCSEEGTY